VAQLKDAIAGKTNSFRKCGWDALRTAWLTYCGVIYKNKCITDRRIVKKKVRWGRDFSQRIEIRRLEIGGICGG